MQVSDIDPEQLAARTRAAIAYSGKDYKDIGAVVGKSPATLARRSSPGTNYRGPQSMEEVYRLADACGVPRSFMEHGFMEQPASADARIDELERKLDGFVEALINSQPARVSQLLRSWREGIRPRPAADKSGSSNLGEA